MTKDWGPGIPKYTKDDLMTAEELLDFAMNIVFQFEVEKNGYEVLSSNNDLNRIPNFVLKKDGVLYFIVVEAAIAKDMPKLSPHKRANLLRQAEKFNAVSYYAPVGFGSADLERFNASLALRGDGYYTKYTGMEKIEAGRDG